MALGARMQIATLSSRRTKTRPNIAKASMRSVKIRWETLQHSWKPPDDHEGALEGHGDLLGHPRIKREDPLGEPGNPLEDREDGLRKGPDRAHRRVERVAPDAER